jgi:hypothetical protein
MYSYKVIIIFMWVCEKNRDFAGKKPLQNSACHFNFNNFIATMLKYSFLSDAIIY